MVTRKYSIQNIEKIFLKYTKHVEKNNIFQTVITQR